MLNRKNASFYNVLFSNNKIIKCKDNAEKNISEELLTIRTLVLLQRPQDETAEMAQLEKILAACTLQKSDYKVIYRHHSWSDYRQYANIREVLLFGITESDLNISIQFNENQINKFDERIWIKTASISEMTHNQSIKNALWQNALKPHFVS